MGEKKISLKNMKEPPDPGDKPWATYQCIKTSLKSVVKDDIVVSKLMEAALRANGIMIHTLQLLKLYLIHSYDTGVPLPLLDRRFVTSIMKVLCEEPASGRPPSGETKLIKDTLKAFYEQHYKATMSEELNYRHMNTVLHYLSTDILTMYENNIKQHYVEYVERFVNVSWRKKVLVAIIKKHKKTVGCRQEATNALCRQLCRVKNDLLRPDQAKTSHTLYHTWIDEQRAKVVPTRG